MHEMERRRLAVEATRTRFKGKPFAWGRVDCAKVAAFHARQMGHRRSFGLAKAGSYSSALGARRALKRAGHDGIAAALDAAGLDRIAPAAALPGDLLIAPGGDGWEAVTILLGNMAVLGFHDDDLEAGLLVIRLTTLAELEAWRT